MPRKSSIHFKPVTNIRFAVSHSERTDLSEPGYLLPQEHQLPNIVVTGSLSENELAALFIQQKEGMTGQAKARGSSPFWEGVVVLPNTNGQEQSTNLQAWKKAYEKETCHKVLHMSVHLDEGYLDALGKPQYNPHAHVIVSRMDEKNRVISLGRKQLANVQDLTAEQLKMERGSTLEERQGKRGRQHIPHREFRAQADEKRLDFDNEKARENLLVNLNKTPKKEKKNDNTQHPKLAKEPPGIFEMPDVFGCDNIHDIEHFEDLLQQDAPGQLRPVQTPADHPDLQQLDPPGPQIGLLQKALADLTTIQKQLDGVKAERNHIRKLFAEDSPIISNLKNEVVTLKEQAVELAQLNEQYRLAREALKASGEAQQADYQALKKAHEAALANLNKAQIQAAKVPDLEEQAAKATKQASEAQTLITQYQRDREALKASGDAQQTDYQALKKALEAALEKVETLTAENAAVKANAPSLANLVRASYVKFVEWITANSGKRIEIDTQSSDYFGPVVQLDDLHAVQRVGIGKFAIHQLAHLDKLPGLNDPKTEIKYQGGFGQVVGKLGQTLER